MGSCVLCAELSRLPLFLAEGSRYEAASAESSPLTLRRSSMSSAASDSGCYNVHRQQYPHTDVTSNHGYHVTATYEDAVYVNVPLMLQQASQQANYSDQKTSPLEGSSRESLSSAHTFAQGKNAYYD